MPQNKIDFFRDEPMQDKSTLADRTNRVVSGKKQAAKDLYLAKSRYITGKNCYR